VFAMALDKVNKILLVLTIIMTVGFSLVVVGMYNFNSNKTLYLRFSGDFLQPNGYNVTRLIVTASMSDNVTVTNGTNEFVVTTIYSFEFYDATTGELGAPWEALGQAFNGRIVTQRNFYNFTLWIYAINSVGTSVILVRNFRTDYLITSVYMVGVNETTQEVNITLKKLNPVFELFNYL
jgi:hypothetical protein